MSDLQAGKGGDACGVKVRREVDKTPSGSRTSKPHGEGAVGAVLDDDDALLRQLYIIRILRPLRQLGELL